MAAEAKRGCGYRKIGGTYLESDPGITFSCGRMPIPLLPCPLCDQRPRFTRGLQQLTPKNILHAAPPCGYEGTPRCAICPFNIVMQQEVVGLMWVGGKFYTPESFIAEAVHQGISKRLGTIPKWFKVGTLWVFLAHERSISAPCETCNATGKVDPVALDIAVDRGAVGTKQAELFVDCPDCEGEGTRYTPGIFYAFKPQRIVRCVSDLTTPERITELEEQGFSVVMLPHTDPDHQGKEDDE